MTKLPCTCRHQIPVADDHSDHSADCPTTATVVWWESPRGDGALVCPTLRAATDEAHRIADADPDAVVRFRLPDAETD